MAEQHEIERLPKILAIDFDGTLCKNAYPEIGIPKHHVIDDIKKYKSAGYKLILWTCRTGHELQLAIDWCKKQDLTFDAINDNLPEVKAIWPDNARKVYADLYIDDKAVPV